MKTKNTTKDKYVIGIDMNITGNGYSVLHTDANDVIIDIPYKGFSRIDDKNISAFSAGSSFETKAAIRRGYRGIRRNINHKKQVKKRLIAFLDKELNFKYDSTYQPIDMLDLKIKALYEKITEQEFSSILYNYVSNRGYFELDDEIKTSSSTKNKEEEDFKTSIITLKTNVDNSGLSVSEYKKKYNISAHDKAHIVLSSLHRDELIRIWNKQSEFYPILTQKRLDKIMRTIYFRFNPKSYRKLIGECEVETYEVDGIKYGKKVSKKSQPSYEEFISWSQIHNIVIIKNGVKSQLSDSDKKSVFVDLCKKYKDIDSELLLTYLFDKWFQFDNTGIVDISDGVIYPYTLLGLTKKDFLTSNKKRTSAIVMFYNHIDLKCNNKTVIKGTSFTNSVESLLTKYNVDVNSGVGISSNWGGLSANDKSHYPSDIYYNTNIRKLLYDIYHILNSSTFTSKIKTGLNNILTDIELCDELSKISYNEERGSFSLKAINKMLPYMNGDVDMISSYDAKCKLYGEEVIEVETNAEEVDKHIGELKRLTNSSVRNPLVMNVVNNAIDIINNIIKTLPTDSELILKIELSRELCADKDKRKRMFNGIEKNRRLNAYYRELLNSIDVKATYKNITTVKLFIEQIEIDPKFKILEAKVKADDIKLKSEFKNKLLSGEYKCSVIYNDKKISFRDAFSTGVINHEHTIPKSKYNTNDMVDLTLCDVETNDDKGNMTGNEYISTKSLAEQHKIQERIKLLYQNKKAKYFEKNSDDIVDMQQTNNQLTLTSYMSTLLSYTIRKQLPNCKLYYSNGGVTNMIKDDMGINSFFKDYIFNGITTTPYVFKPNFVFNGEVIKNDLNKRMDDRHHFLDSLIVALVDHNVLFYANNKNKNKDTDAYKRRNIKIKILKQFGIIDNNIVLTNDDIEALLPTLHSKIKTHIDSCIVYSVKKGDKIFNKNGCTGVSEPIHEETFYGKSKKSIKYDDKKGVVATATHDVYTIRKPFDSIYCQKSVAGKIKYQLYEYDGGNYQYILEKDFKDLMLSMTFEFINNEEFKYQGHLYNINNHFKKLCGVKVGDKEQNIYIDINFKSYFFKTSDNTEGIYLDKKVKGLKTIKFSNTNSLEKIRDCSETRKNGSIRKGVYAACSEKYDMVIYVENDKYMTKTTSLNSKLKNTNVVKSNIITTLKPKEYYFIGIDAETIKRCIDSDDISYLNHLYYINGLGDKNITMLKYNQSRGFLSEKYYIVDKKTHLSDLSKIDPTDVNIRALKCLTSVEFDILGKIKLDSLKTITFMQYDNTIQPLV